MSNILAVPLVENLRPIYLQEGGEKFSAQPRTDSKILMFDNLVRFWEVGQAENISSPPF